MSRLGRLASPLLGVLLAATLFAHAGRLDEWSGPERLGPSFWPRVVLLGLGLACAGRLGVEWRRRPRVRLRPAPDEILRGSDADGAPPLARARLAVALALLVGYVAATPAVGFPLATAGFVLGFMWLAGARSASGILAAASLGTLGLLYLFVKLVYLPLPKGETVFEAFTLALYRALRIF